MNFLKFVPSWKTFYGLKIALGTLLEKILPTPMLLLLFVCKIGGKDKTSLHCSQGCRYSMQQNVTRL